MELDFSHPKAHMPNSANQAFHPSLFGTLVTSCHLIIETAVVLLRTKRGPPVLVLPGPPAPGRRPTSQRQQGHRIDGGREHGEDQNPRDRERKRQEQLLSY